VGSGISALVTIFATSNASVSNGTIRGMGSAGMVIGSGHAYKIHAFANGADGIDALNDSFVSECISDLNGGIGLFANGTAMNNIVLGNSGDGIVGVNGLITGNKVAGNANGINAQLGLISGNFVNANAKAGILASCPANIVGNEVSNNTGGSIVTSGSGCQLVNNN
jgi:hypothetical protein